MTTPIHITATEHGVVRLFAVETARAFDHSALASALGVTTLETKHADLIEIADLDELGLEGYLTLGMGIPAEEIAPLQSEIRALTGTVALVRSAAFGGIATTLTPKTPLRWIASFGETPLDLSTKPLQSTSAQGTISSAPAEQRMSNNRVLLWVLLAFGLMLALTISMFVRIAQ